MPETKIEATHRLQREGRWTEATEFRERIRVDRREAGDSRAIANDKAWEAMSLEFPPIQISVPQSKPVNDPFSDGDDGNEPDLPQNLPVGSATFQEDLTWAYRNIASTVTEAMAPSGGAWALRAWGRSEKGRDKFFAVALKVMAPREAENSRLKDDRSRQFSLLDNLMRELGSRELAGIEQRCPLCNGVFTHEQQAAHSKLAQSIPQGAARGTNAGSRLGS